MRAGPLSNPKVIELLNRYFVPVVRSNGDAGLQPRSPEEKAEQRRIYLDFHSKGLKVGDVHVFLLGPDLHPIEGIDIIHAAETDYLVGALQRTVAKLNTVGGAPVVKPTAQSFPPPHDGDAMVFHLVARGGGQVSWANYGIPVENWIVLNRAEWSSLLPPGQPAIGSTWNINPRVASRLLNKFYPQIEESNPGSPDRLLIDQQSLMMKIVSMKDGIATARIDGALHMGLRDNSKTAVNAKLAGFMDFSPAAKRIDLFRLVTTTATYGSDEKSENLDVALRSVQPSPTEGLASNPVATAPATAVFLKSDSTTRGNWRSLYGADGYNVIGDTAKNPTYAAPTASGHSSYTWEGSTRDARALRKASSASDRVASTWYSERSFTIDLNTTDQAQHQVALYCVDYDSTARRQTIEVLDGNWNVLNTQTLNSSYNQGVYLVWNVSGPVKFRISWIAGHNSVVSGVFFGGPSASQP